MQRWEDLTENEKQAIRERISFQNLLEEVADVDYQAFYLGIDADELYDKLLAEFK